MESKFDFPKQISSIRTKDDIKAACAILLFNTMQSWQLIGEPTLRLESYQTQDDMYSPCGSVLYPVWRQPILITQNNGQTTRDYTIVFHEVDQSVRIERLCSDPKIIPVTPIGRKFIISKDNTRVKTVYDDSFLATPKQAAHRLSEVIPQFKWNEIYRAEPKILKDGRAIWLITCEYNWKYALDIIGNPFFPKTQIHSANTCSKNFRLEEHPMIAPYDDLQDPILGKDYLAFDLQKSRVREVTGLIALRFTGDGFFPVGLSKAKFPFALTSLKASLGKDFLMYY